MKLIIKNRHYNGKISDGNILESEYIFKIKDTNLAKTSVEEKFVFYNGVDPVSLLGKLPSSKVKVSLPVLLTEENLVEFNNIITEIQTNEDYKIKEEKSTVFNPNNLMFVDLYIDKKHFKIKKDDLKLKELFKIIEIEKVYSLVNDTKSRIMEGR